VDFISDALSEGRKFRSLNIVDDFNRGCLAAEVDTSITGTRVVRVLERLREQRGLPQALVKDHGPEFAGQALDVWAYERGVKLRFIEPGKPVQNAFIESFNGKMRDGCLNEHRFLSLEKPGRRLRLGGGATTRFGPTAPWVIGSDEQWSSLHFFKFATAMP
jgi:putative transposase